VFHPSDFNTRGSENAEILFFNPAKSAPLRFKIVAIGKSRSKPINPNPSASTLTDWTLGVGISLGFGHWDFRYMAGALRVSVVLLIERSGIETNKYFVLHM
jgi:hypothetical protein